MKTFLPYAYHRGAFIPFEDANISIATHSLHYGTGAFGGMRVFPNPKKSKDVLVYRLDRHAKRLSKSAKFLGYHVSPDFIEKTLIEFIKRNAPQKPSYIRPLVYTSDLDISPRLHNIEFDFLIYGMEMGDYLSPEGVRCTISSYQRQSDVSFPLRGKITGAYITSALAKTEAYYRGFDEAILLNSQNKVSEGSAMNIFLVRERKIITPGVNQDILEGITRDGIIELARWLGYEVEERPIDKSELFYADEVFMSGTAAKITPVSQIENHAFSVDRPVCDHLKSEFEKLLVGEIPEFEPWISHISLD